MNDLVSQYNLSANYMVYIIANIMCTYAYVYKLHKVIHTKKLYMLHFE